MSLDVSGLSAYTDQSSLTMHVAAQVKTKTAALATKVPGVKYKFDLHLLANTPTAQANSGCGFNASGTTAFTARTLTVSKFKYEDNICLRTLENYYTQAMLTKGQDYASASIPQVIMDTIIVTTTAKYETYDWTGTVAGSAKYDGIHTVLNAESIGEANTLTYVGASALTSITKANAISMLDAVYNYISINQPAILDQAGQLVYCVPQSWYAKIVQAYVAANYFSQTGQGNAGAQDMLPYYGDPRLKIMGTVGLEGIEKGYWFNTSNLFLGFDSEGEEAVPKIWFSQDNDTHRYTIKATRGWQVAFTSEVGQFACQNS